MYMEGDVPVTMGGAGTGSGFFNGDGIWAIILLAIIFGWGNGGWGSNRQAGGVTDGYVLASDFSNIERKIDNVNSGICDGFYAMNTGMLNGFAGVTNAITTGGYETRNAISDLSAQLSGCCCENRLAQKDTQFAIAGQTSAIQQSLCTGFRDVIENQNATYRALHDELVANRIEDKNAQIAAQQAEINALRLKASQEAQNSYLINTLRPTAIPAYLTCSPYQSIYGCGTQVCGSVV